jgi:hypothetical protein
VAANAAMLTGTGIWAVHFLMGWEIFLAPVSPFQNMQLPLSLSATACALLVYLLIEPPWQIVKSRRSA